mgnify:FL=1|jgi:hypothetical protein
MRSRFFPVPLDRCTYTMHTGHMNTNRPALPVHVVNRCKFAALTFGNIRAAREYEQRTGRHASACGNCGKWHA